MDGREGRSSISMRKQWSEEETRILKQHYAKYGYQRVQHLLAEHGFERSKKSIYHKAQKEMLYRGNVRGLIPARWITQRPGGDRYYQVLFHACRDGVLTEGAGMTKWFVPEWWAEKYFEERLEAKGTNHRQGTRDSYSPTIVSAPQSVP